MNVVPTRPPRRRDEARALFRNAILDAAEVVFAERGFHGARIQDIAERARIAVGTVYNHFSHKDEVLAALLEERTEGLLAQVSADDGDAEGFGAGLEARITRMLAYVEQHRAFFAIANEHGLFTGAAAPSAGGSARKIEQMETFRSVLRGIVEEGIASGDLEPLDAEDLTRFLASTIRAFVLSSIAEEGKDVREQASKTIDFFLHGAARRRKRTK